MTSDLTPDIATEQTSRLQSGAVGAPGIAFFVIAAAAPLTCVIGITPLVLGFGIGIGAPIAYLLIGALLLVFSVGYVAMTKHVPNPGALYAYIAKGLGPSAGVGAALVSVLVYVVSLVTLTSFFGYSLSALCADLLGTSPPWFACCLVGIALTMALGFREVALGAKLLGVLLTAEIGILIALAIAVLVRGGAAGVTFAPFNPSGLMVGGIGVTLAFAYASYVGFEQTAIYAEEAKDPQRSVKRATFAAVSLITIFYAVITWVVVVAFGAPLVVAAASGSPGSLVFDATNEYLGSAALHAMQILVVTSSFAAMLSFHNATARYAYALGRERILPRALGHAHPRTSSPHRASLVAGIANSVALLAFWLLGTDPYLGVFSWGSASAAVGFIALQIVCAAAVFRYFRNLSGHNESSWTTTISPALAILGLAAVLALVLGNFSSLVGIDVGAGALIVPAALAITTVAGVLYGFRLKHRDHPRWQAVGSGGASSVPTS